jgi:hypothetical protein
MKGKSFKIPKKWQINKSKKFFFLGAKSFSLPCEAFEI